MSSLVRSLLVMDNVIAYSVTVIRVTKPISHRPAKQVGSVSSCECLDAPAILATFTAGRMGFFFCILFLFFLITGIDQETYGKKNYNNYLTYKLQRKKKNYTALHYTRITYST